MNEWYDRRAGEVVYCVADDRYQQVPPCKPRERKKGDGQPTLAVAFHPDRRILAAGDQSGRLRLWDLTKVQFSGDE